MGLGEVSCILCSRQSQAHLPLCRLGHPLPDPGPQPHLGGGPVHPAFRTRVHINEDEALHHLGVVQLQLETRSERGNLAI